MKYNPNLTDSFVMTNNEEDFTDNVTGVNCLQDPRKSSKQRAALFTQGSPLG